MSERCPERFEYVRPLRPLHFPEQAEVPETQRHLELRTALYQLLSYFLKGRATVGSDQFVYYDASDPRACLAPDVFLQLGSDGPEINSWKVWERGTLDLAVEISSRSDAPDEPWERKLGRYHKLGVRELVQFNQPAQRIRVWDYVQGDLAERKLVSGTPVPCQVLGLWWVTPHDERWGPMLRLAHDERGQELILTQAEAEAEARSSAEQRSRQLEEELIRWRKGEG